MKQHLSAKVVKVSGLSILPQYTSLPITNEPEWMSIDKTLTVNNTLVASGDEHAKLLRFAHATFEIRAPRFWWAQMDTYRIGINMYSGSTMHTIPQDLASDDFVAGTPHYVIRVFNQVAKDIMADDSLTRKEKHHNIKCSLPEGFMQLRVVQLSYQTLRRIWLQRRNHRMREWQEFIACFHELPLSEELIFVESRETKFTGH